MFDAGVCGLMNLASEPAVVVEALSALNALLRHATHNLSTAGAMLLPPTEN
ncbi:hypothetical protein [Polaromonas sp. JS666]|uniref:hypothetical protein n=1 Tax=Polaromonas sp. (strain JS666 / ATCC BAA-500) TaxID=296591 RepID=UPI00004646AB|nr:hypothetical protein [Polaromonas sp. JS666]